MVALFSFMTSFLLIALALGLVVATLRGSGAKIVAALAGERTSALIISLPPRPRVTARVISRDWEPMRSGLTLRAAA